MELFYSPLACSLATRIALYEAGASVTYVEVDPKTKKTETGDDYLALHPLALVPLLRTDDGELLFESSAILQYVAERYPNAELAPNDERGRSQLRQWLSYIATELHKATFVPLLDREAPDGAKSYALGKAAVRLGLLDRHLDSRTFLLERFSVADAYLVAILNWTVATAVDLSPHPHLRAYQSRLRERPAVARATAEEFASYQRAKTR